MTTIDRAAIEQTFRQIAPHIRKTPVLEIGADELGLRAGVALKLECLQHSGSFKARGAFANLLTADVPDAGVVAASGGNHGAAVAYAAMRLGIPAKIFVPSISSPAKIARIRAYKADLVIGGEAYADALAASEDWIAQSGAMPVHAYDQEGTLLGQGTAGLEFEAQCPDLDTVLVAVGGGGLIGGIAAALGAGIRVVAVEPERCATLNAALAAGEPVDVAVSGLAADSLGARRSGSLMFPIAQEFVQRSLLVPDGAIADAQRWLWEHVRIAAEPGGATALAALLSGAYAPEPGERVGVLVCGANVPLKTLAETVAGGDISPRREGTAP